jgi:hypothetical protein
MKSIGHPILKLKPRMRVRLQKLKISHIGYRIAVKIDRAPPPTVPLKYEINRTTRSPVELQAAILDIRLHSKSIGPHTHPTVPPIYEINRTTHFQLQSGMQNSRCLPYWISDCA